MKNTQILYEDNEILVINKEAGMSVQGGEGVTHPLDAELSRQVGYKIYLVHRLDRETSGLMVVAKSPASAGKWSSLIAGKQVKKEYTAVCFGIPEVGGEKMMSGTLTDNVMRGGKELSALTYFNVMACRKIEIPSESGEAFKCMLSAVHLSLGTGRMHQIRIHLAKAFSPIVQDDKHGDFRLNRKIRRLGIKRLCLAATRLCVPIEGKNTVFEINPPEHIQKALSLLT